MQFGIYKKIDGKTGVGHLYQFLMLARHHTTGKHFVLYIPLRIEPEWAGTIRPCLLERELFERKFEFVGEALPEDLSPCSGTPTRSRLLPAAWQTVDTDDNPRGLFYTEEDATRALQRDRNHGLTATVRIRPLFVDE